MHWKIERDSIYKDIYEKDGEKGLIEAGFIFDSSKENFKIEDSLNILCTPIHFIKENLKGKSNPCILLMSGSFAPFHKGHLGCMEAAKKELEKNGFDVVGGFFAPDHDEYISNKIKSDNYDINKRIKLINDVVDQTNWIRVDTWAGLFRDCAINFTEILKRLELYLNKYLQIDIPIFFICGGDNQDLSRAFKYNGQCVVVSRPNYQIKKINNHHIFYAELNEDISSTKIRANHWDFEENKDLYFRIESNKLIVQMFEEDLLKELQKHFNKVNLIKIWEQEVFFDKLRKEYKVISLDPLLYGDYNLEISREYDLFGMNKLGYCERPHSLPLDEQLKRIPKGKYLLWDDDAVTGKTLEYAKNLLAPYDIEVETKTWLKSKPNEEVLDSRDFRYHTDGGLVIRQPNGQPSRLPYILPHVNTYIRASILNSHGFSDILKMLNDEYTANSS